MDIVPKDMPSDGTLRGDHRRHRLACALAETAIFLLPVSDAPSHSANVHQADGTVDEAAYAENLRRPPLLLLRADRPKRLFNTAGFRILQQRRPGCFATLRARKLLRRYHGALDSSAKKANDDQNMDHNCSPLSNAARLVADAGKVPARRPCGP